jgi:hypothetical protein
MQFKITIPVALVVATLIGVGGGLLSWVGGANIANSIMTGFAALGGTVTVTASLTAWQRRR